MDNSKIKEKLIDIILEVEEGMWGGETNFKTAGELRGDMISYWTNNYDLSMITRISLTKYLLELLIKK